MSEVTLIIGGTLNLAMLGQLLDNIDSHGMEKHLPFCQQLLEKVEMTEASFIRHFKPGEKKAKTASGVEFTTNISGRALALEFKCEHSDEWEDAFRMLRAAQTIGLHAKMYWMDKDENDLDTGGRVIVVMPGRISRDYRLAEPTVPLIPVPRNSTFGEAVELLQEAERARETADYSVPPLNIITT